MNDLQDKQYLALELTKIKCDKINNNGIYSRENIMEDYWYFLESLTEVFEKVARLEELEKENEKLRGLLKLKTDDPERVKKLQRITDVINHCKGDMEPYVYQQLMDEIQLKIL